MGNVRLNRRSIVAVAAGAIAALTASPALGDGDGVDSSDADVIQDAIDLTAEVQEALKAQGTSIDEQLAILSKEGGADVPDGPSFGPSEITSDDILRNSVRAIAASFVALNYRLSAELVIHALKRTGGTYTPNYGSRAKNSPVVAAIRRGVKTSGSSAFKKTSGGSYAADLYYSIHLFSYSKKSPSGTAVRISDRYDYEPEKYTGPGIQAKAVSIMELAERRGITKPFQVVINV